jgi:hypothetical protein
MTRTERLQRLQDWHDKRKSGGGLRAEPIFRLGTSLVDPATDAKFLADTAAAPKVPPREMTPADFERLEVNQRSAGVYHDQTN